MHVNIFENPPRLNHLWAWWETLILYSAVYDWLYVVVTGKAPGCQKSGFCMSFSPGQAFSLYILARKSIANIAYSQARK